MLTGNFTKQQPLLATQRSFSAYGFDPAANITGTNGEGTWPGSIIDANGNQWQPGFPACPGNPFLTTYFGTCAYRASAATDLLPESQQGSAMVQLTKTLPDSNSLRVQYFYTRSEVDGYSGPMEYAFEMTPQADPNYFPRSGAGLTCESNAGTGGTLYRAGRSGRSHLRGMDRSHQQPVYGQRRYRAENSADFLR